MPMSWAGKSIARRERINELLREFIGMSTPVDNFDPVIAEHGSE